MANYEFISWEEDGVWSSHVPAIPGVYGIGSSARAAEKDLAEGLELLSEYLTEIGEHLPRPKSVRVGQVRI